MAEVNHETLIAAAFPPGGHEPKQFQSLLDRADADETALGDFLAAVDDSDYSLADWVDALLAFDRWLAAHGTAARPFASMTGYLDCCAAAAPRTVGVLPALQALLLRNLEEYGFDAAQERS